MIGQADVTACLVTRGDQPRMMSRIIDSLVFENVVVWNNALRPVDWKCAGRYMAAACSDTRFVYFQDDDVIVPRETQMELLDAWDGECEIVANWGHGENPDGYDDLPLVGAGAIADAGAAWRAILRYAQHYPLDDDFKYEADFVVGALYESFRHLRLPFEIDLDAAQHPSRLCNQPWQRDLKYAITERARRIRDAELVAA